MFQRKNNIYVLNVSKVTSAKYICIFFFRHRKIACSGSPPHRRQVTLWTVNSLRPRQNSRLFTDDTFKRIFLNENIRISTKSSLKFVARGLINNIPALVLIMAWRRPGDKPLSETMLVRSLTHICITWPQWVNPIWSKPLLLMACPRASLRHRQPCIDL